MFQAEHEKITILKTIVYEGGGWRGYGFNDTLFTQKILKVTFIYVSNRDLWRLSGYLPTIPTKKRKNSPFPSRKVNAKGEKKNSLPSTLETVANNLSTKLAGLSMMGNV